MIIDRLIYLRKQMAILRREEQELTRCMKRNHAPGDYGRFRIIERPSRTITVKAHLELRVQS